MKITKAGLKKRKKMWQRVKSVTWSPSKKLSPMMMTVPPPVVQPSLGEMALMQGMAAAGYRPGYRAE